MIHFQSKAHLLMWLEANCPRKAIVRALRDGTVEHLGGFSTIPPTSHPGWIVKVTSTFGKEFIVAVIAYRNKPKTGIRILSEVPWIHWCGDAKYGVTCIGTLYGGDFPEEYQARRLHETPVNWEEPK